MGVLQTDYLVVGGGVGGLAFTDSLVTHADAEVLVVDRRHRPGGHWNDAYPFVRLHAPSATYGVASRTLGRNAVDTQGVNAGFYERATAAEICDYLDKVLDEQLLPSGRVRFLGMHEHSTDEAGRHWVLSRLTGQAHEVEVRRKVVDATYLESSVPSTHVPSFAVDTAARFVPVNALVAVTEAPGRYVVIGAGKTAMDACTWLLDNGVDPDRIRWIRPRDAWLLDRATLQPLEQVASIVEGASLDLEAVTCAASLEDLWNRLEERGRLLRLDPDVAPTMYRCAMVSRGELEQLRCVTDVARLGRVLRVERDRVVLEGGSVPLGSDDLVVDCSAKGVHARRARPVFEPGKITLQQIRACSPSFNSSLTGFVEATQPDPVVQNQLCPSTPYPAVPTDWLRLLRNNLRAAAAWRADREVDAWVDASRLNITYGLHQHLHEPRMQQALSRYAEHVRATGARIEQLLPESELTSASHGHTGGDSRIGR